MQDFREILADFYCKKIFSIYALVVTFLAYFTTCQSIKKPVRKKKIICQDKLKFLLLIFKDVFDENSAVEFDETFSLKFSYTPLIPLAYKSFFEKKRKPKERRWNLILLGLSDQSQPFKKDFFPQVKSLKAAFCTCTLT